MPFSCWVHQDDLLDSGMHFFYSATDEHPKLFAMEGNTFRQWADTRTLALMNDSHTLAPKWEFYYYYLFAVLCRGDARSSLEYSLLNFTGHTGYTLTHTTCICWYVFTCAMSFWIWDKGYYLILSSSHMTWPLWTLLLCIQIAPNAWPYMPKNPYDATNVPEYMNNSHNTEILRIYYCYCCCYYHYYYYTRI